MLNQFFLQIVRQEMSWVLRANWRRGASDESFRQCLPRALFYLRRLRGPSAKRRSVRDKTGSAFLPSRLRERSRDVSKLRARFVKLFYKYEFQNLHLIYFIYYKTINSSYEWQQFRALIFLNWIMYFGQKNLFAKKNILNLQ